MKTRVWLWLLPGVLYALFWFWYTPQGGPLTAAEIERYVAAFETSGVSPERLARLRRFMEEDSGGQFIMVNVIDMVAEPAELPATGPGASADELLDHYMEHMYPELLRRASHPVFAGAVVGTALDLAGIDGAESWTRVALMRYRSRRDMLEIATNPAFGDRHDYKLAAMDKTIAIPVETQLYLSDPRALLALVLLMSVAFAGLISGALRKR
jgi:hypothetical protein